MKLDADKLYEEYVEDVVSRCTEAIKLQEQEKEELQELSVDILKEECEKIIIQEEKYRKSKNQSLLENLKKRIIPRAYSCIFWDTDEMKKLFNYRQDKLNEIDESQDLTEKQKQVKREILNSYADLTLENMFDKLSESDKEKCLKNFYINFLSERRSEQDTRKYIQEILGKDTIIDTSLDKGNCTKAITSSLLILEKKYDIKIFKHLKRDGIENILHPKQLIEYLAPYVKSSETGNLKDIEDIKRGDIFLPSWDGETPHHAMMCYDFNSNGEALLLGFSNNTINYNGFYKYNQTPLKGIIIDIHSLIKDACHGKTKIKKKINDNSR